MAKYEDVEMISDEYYNATIIPESFIEKLKLAYMMIFHNDKLRVQVIVEKEWFDDRIRKEMDG